MASNYTHTQSVWQASTGETAGYGIGIRSAVEIKLFSPHFYKVEIMSSNDGPEQVKPGKA